MIQKSGIAAMKQIERNRKNFLKYGLPDNLINKLIQQGYTVDKVRSATKNDLGQFLSKEETDIAKERTKRQQIPDEVFARLVTETELSCCFCWNIGEEKPIIIHHIDEYNRTQDNSFNNLIVLCLNHHAEVHTKREISRQNYPKIRLLNQKEKWIEAVSQYRAGNRPAPGEESESPKINVVNSPYSITTVNQKGDNIVYQASPHFSRSLTDDQKRRILSTLKSFSIVKVSIRFEYGAETNEFVQMIKHFLEDNGFEVYVHSVMQSEIPRNEFAIKRHPQDQAFARITVGSII